MFILDLPSELIFKIFGYCNNQTLRTLKKCDLFSEYFYELTRMVNKEYKQHMAYWESIYKNHFKDKLQNDNANIMLGLEIDSERWPEKLIEIEHHFLDYNKQLLKTVDILQIDTIMEINFKIYEIIRKNYPNLYFNCIFNRPSLFTPKYIS